MRKVLVSVLVSLPTAEIIVRERRVQKEVAGSKPGTYIKRFQNIDILYSQLTMDPIVLVIKKIQLAA